MAAPKPSSFPPPSPASPLHHAVMIETPEQSPARPKISLEQPNKKGPSKSAQLFRRVRSLFRSFPIIIINPPCRMPASLRPLDCHIHAGTRMTGTLFGHRKSRVNLSIQENPRCLPMVVLELSINTEKLLQDMGMGLLRIALECEKVPSEKTKLMEEPVWIMYCNGRKVGYAVKREPTEDDLNAMEMLRAVSMGAGVLPGESPEGELTYMRAYFERVIGSKDSETYYMMSPDGNSGPELSIFFVRI
ncbi:unnamed protein product [Ilex paraguariensis]|uniref:Protein MIZU-KUSSEI 1 n=1 Tax=Ilex paraguariensis TaxID=185542 RepID=A0ABC8QLZ6_9AQUA